MILREELYSSTACSGVVTNTLTKKDFERIALLLGNGNVEGKVVWNFADWLKEQNPRFDTNRFIDKVKWYRDNR